MMAGKPGSKEEHEALQEWVKENCRYSYSQVCKENRHAIENIDASEEEYY